MEAKMEIEGVYYYMSFEDTNLYRKYHLAKAKEDAFIQEHLFLQESPSGKLMTAPTQLLQPTW